MDIKRGDDGNDRKQNGSDQKTVAETQPAFDGSDPYRNMKDRKKQPAQAQKRFLKIERQI